MSPAWQAGHCARRSVARGAGHTPSRRGPPPMITTSASICGRSIPSMALAEMHHAGMTLRFGFPDLFSEGRHDVEQVAHNTVVGKFRRWALPCLC